MKAAARAGVRQAEIDHLHHQAFIRIGMLASDHHVRGLDVAMHDAVTVRRGERAGDLSRDPQREHRWERAGALHERFRRFALDELHRVKEPVGSAAQMVNRGHVPVAKLRRGAGLLHKVLPRGLIAQRHRAEDLQRDRALQIYVLRLVGHAGGAAPEFPRRAIAALADAVMVKRKR